MKQTLTLVGLSVLTLSANAAVVITYADIRYANGVAAHLYYDGTTAFEQGTHTITADLDPTWDFDIDYQNETVFIDAIFYTEVDEGVHALDIGEVSITFTVNADNEVSLIDFNTFGYGLNDGEFYMNFNSASGQALAPLYAYESSSIGSVVVGEVPVPAAAWLFGSALIGLVGIKRTK